jgi:hypothetical protein
VSRAWTGREPQTHRPRRGVHEETRNAAVFCKHHAVGESWQVDVAVLSDHASRALEFANDAYRLLRNGMQERDESLGERKRFGQMLYAANEGTATHACPVARLVGAAPGITERILRLRRTALRDQEGG